MESKLAIQNERKLQEISICLQRIIERMEDQSSAIQNRMTSLMGPSPSNNNLGVPHKEPSCFVEDMFMKIDRLNQVSDSFNKIHNDLDSLI